MHTIPGWVQVGSTDGVMCRSAAEATPSSSPGQECNVPVDVPIGPEGCPPPEIQALEGSRSGWRLPPMLTC